jgi:hypothetical protein
MPNEETMVIETATGKMPTSKSAPTHKSIWSDTTAESSHTTVKHSHAASVEAPHATSVEAPHTTAMTAESDGVHGKIGKCTHNQTGN